MGNEIQMGWEKIIPDLKHEQRKQRMHAGWLFTFQYFVLHHPNVVSLHCRCQLLHACKWRDHDYIYQPQHSSGHLPGTPEERNSNR